MILFKTSHHIECDKSHGRDETNVRSFQQGGSEKFERRTWQVGETFNEYYHDKIIMAIRISIDTDEIIDYVVEGIPDCTVTRSSKAAAFQGCRRSYRGIQEYYAEE